MIKVSEVKYGAPAQYSTVLQQRTYEALAALGADFVRVDNDEARTMEDCIAINERLQCRVVKTLFLCNRQKTSFYLFITEGDKPFVTRNFSHILGVSRVSFAPPELLLSMLGTEVGATTVFGLLLDTEHAVRVVIDEDVLKEDTFGCTDGTLTTYMKLKTEDVFRLLDYTGHRAEIINVNL